MAAQHSGASATPPSSASSVSSRDSSYSKGRLYPFVQVIDEDVEQDHSQHSDSV